MAKIKLDLTRNDVLYVRGNTGDNCRYIQDGVRFTGGGDVIGDEQKILEDRKQQAVDAAKAKLDALQEDMLKAEAELSESTTAELAEAKAKADEEAREALKVELRKELEAEEAAKKAAEKAAEKPATKAPKTAEVEKTPPKTAPKAPKA